MVLIAWVRRVPFPRCSGNQGAVEMKRISITGLFLAAVFALSAMTASSASATPGLLLARVVGGGSIAGVSFLSSAKLTQLFTHGGSAINCTDGTNHGLWLSSTLGDILIQFLGCTALGGAIKCSTAGAGAEEIHLPLGGTSFHLGLAHLSSTVGKIPAIVILLNKDVFINCGSGDAEILVLGAVIGALQLDPSEKPIPLNAPFSTAILNFQQTANGEQHLRLLLFEDTLNTYDLHSLVTELGTTKPLELSSEVALALLDLFTLNSGKHVELELFED
jgi:hypothetical protein